MLKQSLEDEIKFGSKDMSSAKKGLAAAGQAKAAAEGDLDITSKDLSEDQETLRTLHHDCLTQAQDFEAASQSRSEELKALADAKKIISESSNGAERITYGLAQASLLQLSRLRASSGADLAIFEVVRFVRDLARKQGSEGLAQLASRLSSTISSSVAGSGKDPFGKVKGLIAEMIERLEASASSDASHKAYCDKELLETRAKKDDHDAQVEKMSVSLGQMTSNSAQLKEQVAVIQKELADLAGSQAQMDTMRQEEHAAFVSDRADMEKGLEGVKLALRLLREYYGSEDQRHEAAAGAGRGVIGLLEVISTDFSKDLAGVTVAESTAQSEYEAETKENAITKASKEQDVKYKSDSAARLDKSIGELTADRSSEQAQLDAVLEYLGQLDKMCGPGAPETYAERSRRREAELAGLKEALAILEGEAVLLQQGAQRKLRTARPHAAE